MLVMEIHHFFPKHTKHKKRVFRVAYSLGAQKVEMSAYGVKSFS